jgi:hypothetical protein
MISRRGLLGAAAGAGALALVPGAAAEAAEKGRTHSANGWRIEPARIASYRIAGSAASVSLRQGAAAAVLLHIARRWHYEIGALDTGEGGGVLGHREKVTIHEEFESNHLSGTALALYPAAFPLGGSERLWPHQEAVVRDILVDCGGTVLWGGDRTPVTASHFSIAVGPRDRTLARVAATLDTTGQRRSRRQTAGAVADPAEPARRSQARRMTPR